MITHNPDIDFIVYIDLSTNIEAIRIKIYKEEKLSSILKNAELKAIQKKKFEEAEMFLNSTLNYMQSNNIYLFF